jgi:nucleotide-binding universal stress UspA family protein
MNALRWAIRHSVKGDLIRAVYVWQIYRGALPHLVPLSEIEALRPEADEFVADTVDSVVSELGTEPDAEIERVSYYGHPGKWLSKLSQEADLVVVSRRGHSTVQTLLLGSVSSYVVHHAHCPVAVIPVDRVDDSRS